MVRMSGCRINKNNVTHRIIDGETVILNLKNGYYYSLGEVGTAIWKRLRVKRTVRDLLNFLKEEYSLPEKRLERVVSR